MAPNYKQECFKAAIADEILYYMSKHDGKKPTAIFMSKPLHQLIYGKDSKFKTKFCAIKVNVYDDYKYEYWLVGDDQKGRDP